MVILLAILLVLVDFPDYATSVVADAVLVTLLLLWPKLRNG